MATQTSPIDKLNLDTYALTERLRWLGDVAQGNEATHALHLLSFIVVDFESLAKRWKTTLEAEKRRGQAAVAAVRADLDAQLHRVAQLEQAYATTLAGTQRLQAQVNDQLQDTEVRRDEQVEQLEEELEHVTRERDEARASLQRAEDAEIERRAGNVGINDGATATAAITFRVNDRRTIQGRWDKQVYDAALALRGMRPRDGVESVNLRDAFTDAVAAVGTSRRSVERLLCRPVGPTWFCLDTLADEGLVAATVDGASGACTHHAVGVCFKICKDREGEGLAWRK